MLKITVGVEGMMCGMCEKHVDDGIKAAFAIKKVSSSRTKKQTIIISEEDISDDEIKRVINDKGFEVKDIKREEYKKGLFF